MVRKANGSWRPCGDYRLLNAVTKKDTYPLPNIKDFVSRLAGKKIFSTLDLAKGYWQLPLARSSVEKSAVITPFGCFVFDVMPFGLMNA